MRFLAPLLVFAVATLVAVPRDAGAGRIDSTDWVLNGTDRLQVSGRKPVKTHITGAGFSIDGTSHFTATKFGQDYSGTLTDKPRRAFKGTADQTTVDEFQSRLVDFVKLKTGASSVTVRHMKVTMSGQVSKTGQKLTLKFTARLNGSAVVRGHRFAGSATETGTYTGLPM